MNRDRLSARLLATFLAELDEQLRGMDADLLALESRPDDAERLRGIFRAAHTLKGAAHAAGVPLIEEACHSLETLLAPVQRGEATLGGEQFSLLFSAVDALTDAGARIRAGEGLDGSRLSALIDVLHGRRDPFPAPVRSRPPTPAAPLSPPPSPPAPEPSPSAPAPAAPADDAPTGPGGEQVRVEAEKLDALLAATGQLLIASGRIDARAAEMQQLQEFVARWAQEWRRAGPRLRRALDETRASSAVRESLEAVETHLGHLAGESARAAAGATDDARSLSGATRGIGGQVHRLRMRPFADACQPLPRAVRDLATAAGKEVHLEIQGAGAEADRAVLDGLREPLLHLVRNAVDHGIEPPRTREQSGKPPAGTVTVSATLRGDRLVVTVADDGAGVDLGAVREQLERRARLVPHDARELARQVFEPGFSTRDEATTVSGRGVGLDIVRTAVGRLRGSVDIEWSEGSGTTFTIECPTSLATLRAVLVGVGAQVLAIPTADVERFARVRPEEVLRVEGREVIRTDGAPVPLVSLARLLGPPLVEKPLSGATPVVRLHAGARRLAVVVDALLEEQEVVVRPLERVRNLPPHVSGAAILATGKVALVLNPAALLAAGLGTSGPGLSVAEHGTGEPSRPRILVVDDSITTRTLEQSILEAAGYDVLTAADGADGWRILQEAGADLVISDVEMPRMDGFALCQAIRASKRFASLPVVLVTALEAPEHRARGLEAGADAYLPKSSFDQQDLLDAVRELVG